VSRRRIAFAAPLICLTLAGCGSTKIFTVTKTTPTAAPNTGQTGKHAVDTTQLEHAIAAATRAQRHAKATVVCPPDISFAAGGTFYCAAQSAGVVTPFLVTEQAGGKLTYKGVAATKTPSVDMPQIEIAIAQAMRRDHKSLRSVSCPQEMPRQQGLAFVCTALTAAVKPTNFVVTEVNDIGRVTFAAR
jgi:hypothetical protein